MSKLIEICFSALLAFLILSTISFFTLRPTLKEVRGEAKAEWDAFLRSVNERNSVLPGLAEALKGVEPGQSKLVERLMHARSVCIRAVDPDNIIQCVNDMDRQLAQIGKLAQNKPALEQYPPFAIKWKEVVRTSQRMSVMRRNYNLSARLYNKLLTPFPQNLITAVFGFVPLNDYPAVATIGEASLNYAEAY